MLAVSFSDVVDLVSALVWPATVVVGLLLLRPYLPGLGRWFAARVSKVSVASVTLEMAATEVPQQLLRSLSYVRDPGSSVHPASDARSLLVDIVRGGQRADWATIDLRTGDAWLTSRLYLFSWVLAQLVGVRCLVFVATRDDIPNHFVGLAEPTSVRVSLARSQPWLQRAFVTARLEIRSSDARPEFDHLKDVLHQRRKTLKELQPWDSEVEPALTSLFAAAYRTPRDAQESESVIHRYLNSPLISRTVSSCTPVKSGWVRFGEIKGDGPPLAKEEHASWITNAGDLHALLGDTLKFSTVPLDSSLTGLELQRQVVLREGGEFVAIVDSQSRFEHLVDRRRIAEQVGRDAAEQGLLK